MLLPMYEWLKRERSEPGDPAATAIGDGKLLQLAKYCNPIQIVTAECRVVRREMQQRKITDSNSEREMSESTFVTPFRGLPSRRGGE